jgi:hypothetical protein
MLTPLKTFPFKPGTGCGQNRTKGCTTQLHTRISWLWYGTLFLLLQVVTGTNFYAQYAGTYPHVQIISLYDSQPRYRMYVTRVWLFLEF